MKHEDFRSDLYFLTQNEINKLKNEEAKRQKRLWLRTKIHEITGISRELDGSDNLAIFEKIFNWIYQAPLYEWEGMLYCFKKEAKSVCYEICYEKALENAKKLYAFLK